MLSLAEKQKIVIKTIEAPGNNIPFFPKLWHKPSSKAHIPNLNAVWHTVRSLNNKPNPTYINAKNKKVKPLKHLTWFDYLKYRYGDNGNNNWLLNKLKNK